MRLTLHVPPLWGSDARKPTHPDPVGVGYDLSSLTGLRSQTI
jgi:hypothetical protein